MPPINSAYLEHQLKRWMRPDAHHYVRPDWRRFLRPGFEDDHPFALYERKYSPDQPRVPAGNREGGQWTDRPNPSATGEGGPGGRARAEVQIVLERAKRLAATSYSDKYLRCLDVCSPILEIRQPPGADFNQWNFRRCMEACMRR
jgi:hypothetical protein